MKKIFDIVVLLFSILILYICIASRFSTVHWRFTPRDNASGAVAFTIRGEQAQTGFQLAIYYSKDAPEGTIEPSQINDVVFKTLHHMENGRFQVSWLKSGVPAYEGRRTIEFFMAWWAALLCGIMGVLFVAVAHRRGRRPGHENDDDAEDSQAASSD